MISTAQFWPGFLWFFTHVTPLAFLAAVLVVVAFGAARQLWFRRSNRKLLDLLEAGGSVRRHNQKNGSGQSIRN